MLDMLGGIPVINAIGTPRTIGDTIGQRLKPRLQVLAQYLREQLAVALAASDIAKSSDDLVAHLRHLAVPMARSEPSTWMEIETIARATGIAEEDLLLIHGWGDLQSHYGCTVQPMRSSTVLLTGPQADNGQPRLVHAIHLDPTLFPYITLVRRMPTHGPATISLTLAGLHPVVGMSEAGIAVACNELRVTDGSDGHFTSHLVASSLGSPVFGDALARIRQGPRHGGGAMHVLSGSGERATCEVSGQADVQLHDPVADSPRVHTNHALHDTIMPWTSKAPDQTSKDRLVHLARCVVDARSMAPAGLCPWFGMGASGDGHRAAVEGMTPDTTVLMIMEPGSKTFSVKRGGSAAKLESVSL